MASESGTSITVTWPPAAGANEYIVYRSVDGGNDYWRGRINTTTFTDTNRSGQLTYKVASKAADGTVTTRTTCTNEGGPQPIDADFVAFGDVASCGNDGATAVAGLLDVVTQPIWGLGDYAYSDGSAQEFAECFDPKLGRHRNRISPVAGNHDYQTEGAAGYFGYFGAAAGSEALGYYAQTHDGWQILFLNSNCSEVACGAGSMQYQWVQNQIATAPNVCRAVVMHHPRWSSWGPYADQAFLDDLVNLLHTSGTDIIVTGHAHHYERLARLDANQQPDPSGGFRQFTAGTGGITPRTPDPGDVLAVSETLIAGEFGLLALKLDPGSYTWEFVNTNGEVLDVGSDICIN